MSDAADLEAGLLGTMPFTRARGIEVEHDGADEVTGLVAWTADRCTAGRVLHSGLIIALADSLGAPCILQPPGRGDHLDRRVQDEFLPRRAARRPGPRRPRC